MPEVNPSPFQQEQHNAESYAKKANGAQEERQKNEAALRSTLRAFMYSDAGRHFERYLRNIIASRTYFPLESDIGAIAYSEGARFVAMDIADLAGLDLVNFSR